MPAAARGSAWALATAIAVLAAIAVAGQFYYPLPATAWMVLHQLDDFHSTGDLWDFLVRLRTAIPPIAAAAEIAGHLMFGDIRIPLAIACYGSLVACFVMAVLLQRTVAERVVALGLSLVLAAGITASHAANPQSYDLYVPALAIALLAFSLAPPSHWAGWAAAGIILSMLELTRPFMLLGAAILAVPLLRLGARQGRAAVLAFLVPVLLISGGWHAKLLAAHGQLLIGDHAAFNFADALASVGFAVPKPPMESELPGPAGGKWIDLNADVHARNNAALSHTLLVALAEDPAAAMRAVGRRLWRFLALPPTMYGRDLTQPILLPYRWLMRAGVVVSLLALVGSAMRNGWRAVYDPTANFLLYSGFVLFCLAVGTAGEEIRLAAEVAPTIALLPLFVRAALPPGMTREGPA